MGGTGTHGFIERYTPAGTLDGTFGVGGVFLGPGNGEGTRSSPFTDAKLELDGSIVFVGLDAYKDAAGVTHNGRSIGHLSADGVPDANFGPTPDGSGMANTYDMTSTLGGTARLSIDPTTGDIVVGYLKKITGGPWSGYVVRYTHP